LAIDHGAPLRNWVTRGSYRKGDKKRLGFLFGYILIITAPITTMLMATEIGKERTGYFRNRRLQKSEV